MDTTEKHLIIGAGPVGLAHAKALREEGIPYEQLEADDDVGGNWYHGVYETAHIISSKKVTEFKEFPMPENYPDFPSRQNMYDYIKNYAIHFDLMDAIEFNTKVIYVRPIDNNLWEVTLEDGSTRNYKGVLVCNGHHWSRRYPKYEGEFTGEYIHSKDYKRPDQLKGKRVLVIGGGNSACDVASEAARVGAKCYMSMRSGVWFFPKTLLGKPLTDHTLLQQFPEVVQRTVLGFMLKTTNGDFEDYGLQKPTYKIFEKHPTVSTEILHYIKHGRIEPKKDIQRFDGKTVHFVDGSTVEVDMVVAATGYNLDWPFLPHELQRTKGMIAQVYGGSMYADYKGLYIIGTTQPRGGLGSLAAPGAEYQARVIALQNKIDMPMGLVMKKLGQRIPKSHIQSPTELFRKLKMSKLMWPIIERQAKSFDKSYQGFTNVALSPMPRTEFKERKEMVVY